MVKFEINREVENKYKDFKISVIKCKNVRNRYYDNFNEIDLRLANIENNVLNKFKDGILCENPSIISWRNIHRSFGSKPKKYKSSIENLCEYVIKTGKINRISPLVDIYNLISLKYLVPVGGDDVDKLNGDVKLTISNGNEPFQPLNSNEITYPKINEIIYTDDKDVLCRRWNWRECEKSKFTEDTQNAVIYVEALEQVSIEKLKMISKELCNLIKTYCGGENTYEIFGHEIKNGNFGEQYGKSN